MNIINSEIVEECKKVDALVEMEIDYLNTSECVRCFMMAKEIANYYNIAANHSNFSLFRTRAKMYYEIYQNYKQLVKNKLCV